MLAPETNLLQVNTMYSQEIFRSETNQLQVNTMYSQETFQPETNLLQVNTMYSQKMFAPETYLLQVNTMYTQEKLASETNLLLVNTTYSQEMLPSDINQLQVNTMQGQEYFDRDQPIASKYTVSHFSYAPFFQGPHFLKTNAGIEHSLWWFIYWHFICLMTSRKNIRITHANHSATSKAIFTKMQKCTRKLNAYIFYSCFALGIIHGDHCDKKTPKTII